MKYITDPNPKNEMSVTELMCDVNVPEPDEVYRSYQAGILRSIKSSSYIRKISDSNKMLARKAFCEKFQLREIRRYSTLCNALREIAPNLIDHPVEFQFCLVVPLVITQPNARKEEYFREFAFLKTFDIQVIDFTEWAWHYPGRDSCFGLLMNQDIPKSLRQISKQVKNQMDRTGKDLARSLLGDGD